jgi:hydrogenase nickel incorporation protein HypA/HybF
MHEVAVGQAILDTVSERAGSRAVGQVTVRIGHLRQVVPEALQFAWQFLTEGTPFDGCRLEIEQVPAVVVCRDCGERTELTWPALMCAGCGSSDVELVSGEEFLVATMDVARDVEQEVT